MELNQFKKGDRILFNERVQPLEVEESEDGVLRVTGPQGAEYEIYTEDGKLLYCKKGNRRYSSYVNELRKTGEWRKTGDSWTHSKTGAEIRLSKNEMGFWTLETDGIDPEPIDPPKYGYSDKEFAEEDAEKLVNRNPEG